MRASYPFIGYGEGMLLFAAAVAHATPAAFEELRTWGDCTLYKRDKTESRPSAMRAECTWEDVDPAKLSEQFVDFEGYDELVWAIDASEIRAREPDRVLVYQLQKIPFINDREVLLWAEAQRIEGGGVIASWSTATEQPLTPRKHTVRTPHNQGFWRVEPAQQGSLVVHEIEVDAGGVPLPGWLVRAIQTRGFGRLLDDVRDQAVARK